MDHSVSRSRESYQFGAAHGARSTHGPTSGFPSQSRVLALHPRRAVRSPCVLIVDDDDDLRETVADLLVSAGYRVNTADNGQSALEWLDHALALPDLILLDLMMPVMDGWAFGEAKRRRPRLANIPVIVFSANADIADSVNAVGAVAILAKPLHARALLDEISRQLLAIGNSTRNVQR